MTTPTAPDNNADHKVSNFLRQIIEKDLELWRQETEAYEVPSYIGNLVRTLCRQMFAEEWMDKDLSRIALLMERMAGTEIPKTR